MGRIGNIYSELWTSSWIKQLTAALSSGLLLFSLLGTPLAYSNPGGNAGKALSSVQLQGAQIDFDALPEGRLKMKLKDGTSIDKPIEGWNPDQWTRYNELIQKTNLLFGDAGRYAANCDKAKFDQAIANIKKLGQEVQDNVAKDKKHEQALWDNIRKIQDYIQQTENDFKAQLKGSPLANALKKTAYFGAGLALGASGFGIAAVIVGAGGILHNMAETQAHNETIDGLTDAQNKKMNELANMTRQQNKEILKQAVRSTLWNNLNKAIQIRLAQLQRYDAYFKKNCGDKAQAPKVGVTDAPLSDTTSQQPDDQPSDQHQEWQETAKKPLTDLITGQPLKDVVISITPKDSIVDFPSPPSENTGLSDGSPCFPILDEPLAYDPFFGGGVLPSGPNDGWSRGIGFRESPIFADGFESGDTSAWSSTTSQSVQTASNFQNNQLWGDWFLVDPQPRDSGLVHVEGGPDFSGDYTFYGRYASSGDCSTREPLGQTREPQVYHPDDDLIVGGIPIKDGDTVRVKGTCHEKYEGKVGKDKPPSTTVKPKPIKIAVPNSQGREADIATVTKELKDKGIIVDPKGIKWKMLIKGTKAGPSIITIPNHTQTVADKPKTTPAPKPAPKPKKKKIKVFVPTGEGKGKDIDKVIDDLKKKGIKVTDKSKVKWKPLIKGTNKGPATVTVPPDAYTEPPKKADTTKPKPKPKAKPKEKIKVFVPTGEGKAKDIDKVIDDLKKKGIKVTDKSKVKWKPLIKGTDKGPATVTVPPDAYTQPKAATETPKKGEGKDKKADKPSPCPKVTDSGCCDEGVTDENISYEPNRDRRGKELKHSSMTTDPLFQSKGSWGQTYDDQWALKRIGFSDHSKWPKSGQEVIVAVVDTGIDLSHPDLRGSLWINRDEIPDNGLDDDQNGYVDDYYGWNFIDDTANIQDNNGHGTLTAGIIGAWGNNGVGIASVNPHARIMAVKVTDFDNAGGSIELAQGVIYAVDNGAKVINVSIGGKYLTKVEQAAVDYAIEKNVLVVVASGNEGTHTKNTSPAGLPGVITVASTDLTDERVNFSNWGPAIDLAAPGVDILSLRAKNTDFLLFENPDYEPGKAYVGDDTAYYRTAGSSFSAPFVAGVASLLLSVNPQLKAEELKRMLLYSARDIDVPGKDQYTGYGLLDAQAALQADPAFYIDAEIDSVQAVRTPKGIHLQVQGKAVANEFRKAWIELGAGESPTQWKAVSGAVLKQPVENGVLMNIPLDAVRGASQWTIRLITEHRNGRHQENRYNLKLQ